MNQFRLNKLTGALIAAGVVLPAGYAAAQTINVPTVVERGPREGATMFVGAGAQLRVVTATPAGENGAGNDHVLHVFCFEGNGSTVPAAGGTPVPLSDNNATTDGQLFVGTPFAAACGTAGNSVVLIYDTTATGTDGDVFAGTAAQLAVLTANGTFGATASGTVNAAALALAANAGGSSALAVRANYVGPIITSASQGAPNGAVTLNFSANLSGNSGQNGTVPVSAAATTDVDVLKVVDGSPSTQTFLIVNTASTDMLTVASSTAGAGFTSAVNKVDFFDANVFDTAGNQAPGQQVYTNFSDAVGVGFATTGASAVANGFGGSSEDRVNAWNTALSGVGLTGSFDVALRMNEAVSAGAATAFLVTAPLTVAGVGSNNGVDRVITINIPGGSEIGFGSSGQLLVTSDSWATSAPVTIGLNGTAGALMVAASGAQIGTSGVAAVAVVAGADARPGSSVLTLDSNIDGMLDGFTLRTHDQLNLNYTPDAPSLATASGSSLSLLADGSTVALASAVTVNSTIQVNVVLSTLTGANDWDGDGDVDADDAALYTLDNNGTGETNPLFEMRQAAVNATTGLSGLAYSQIVRGTDGTVLPFRNAESATTVANADVDNAPPVVVSVQYIETNAPGEEVGGIVRDGFGDILVVHSEAVDATGILGADLNLGSWLFDGIPATLLNLNANVPSQVVAEGPENGEDPFGGPDVGNSQIRLKFMPATAIGKVLSYPTGQYPADFNTHVTEAGTGAPDYLAVVNSVAASNTVQVPAPTVAEITGASLVGTQTAAGSRIDTVFLNFSENIKIDPTRPNMNGVFIVRARVGAERTSVFENRDAGSIDQYYDFIIPASNVLVGTASLNGPASVTLLIPDGTTSGLPSDTTEVWVDYQPSANGRLVRTLDDVAVHEGDGVMFGNTNGAEVLVTANPQTLPSPIDQDEDTVRVPVTEQFLALKKGKGSVNLLTQTVGGKLELDTNVSVPKNTGIRADLIQVVTAGTKEGGQQDAILLSNDGTLSINRGPNSETGQPQIIALRNNGGLTAADINGFYAALRNYNNGLKAKGVKASMAANQVYALMKAETEALRKYDVDVFGRKEPFESLGDGDLNDASIRGFIEVTTGAGALASSGSNGANQSNSDNEDTGVPYSQNANAEFGRTATLTKNLPNLQKNGTTYYPVKISLHDGDIEPSNGSGDANINWARIPVRAGNPFPEASTEQCRFEVLDTVYALATVGGTGGTQSFYSVTVGSAEAAFANAGGPLNPSATNAFVQISVRNPTTGNYVLLTSADASFNKHIKFVPDLKSNGKLTKKDFEIDDVAIVDVKDQNGWQLLGVVGELDRNSGVPLDPRAFLGVKDDTGAPITNFACDNKATDEAFVLGTDASVPNSVKVAFEGANNTLVNNLRPSAKAAAIAFNANNTQKAAFDSDDDLGQLTDSSTTTWPVNGEASRRVPKLFLPIKPGSTSSMPKLLKNSWHLVTVQATNKTFGSLHSKVDAAIIVDGAKGATAYFRTGANNTTIQPSEAATAHLSGTAIPQGTAIFVHTGGSDLNDGEQL